MSALRQEVAPPQKPKRSLEEMYLEAAGKWRKFMAELHGYAENPFWRAIALWGTATVTLGGLVTVMALNRRNSEVHGELTVPGLDNSGVNPPVTAEPRGGVAPTPTPSPEPSPFSVAASSPIPEFTPTPRPVIKVELSPTPTEDRSGWPQAILEAVGSEKYDFVQRVQGAKHWSFTGMYNEIHTTTRELLLPDGKKMVSQAWIDMYYPYRETEGGEWKLGRVDVSILTQMPNGKLVALGKIDYGSAWDPNELVQFLHIWKEQDGMERGMMTAVSFAPDLAAAYEATGWEYGKINGYGEAVTAYQSDKLATLQSFIDHDTPLPKGVMLLPVDMDPKPLAFAERVNLVGN